MDLVTTATTTRRLMATLGSPVPVASGRSEVSTSVPIDGRDPFHGADCLEVGPGYSNRRTPPRKHS